MVPLKPFKTRKYTLEELKELYIYHKEMAEEFARLIAKRNKK